MAIASIRVAPTASQAPVTCASPLVFRARGLSKTDGSGDVEVRTLRDVDLDIARGEFIVLLGASGSGKSTLLDVLGRLDVPSGGSLHFGQRDLTASSEAMRALDRQLLRDRRLMWRDPTKAQRHAERIAAQAQLRARTDRLDMVAALKTRD